MSDPTGATEDGAYASGRLEEMAQARGWTKQQTTNASDWAAVGAMALSDPPAAAPTPGTNGAPPAAAPQIGTGGPVLGSRWLYAKRTKDGVRLKNNAGEPFPPQEVEVAAVDVAGGTCSLKYAKDGKDVTDIRGKKPAEVKWEWLEAAVPPY